MTERGERMTLGLTAVGALAALFYVALAGFGVLCLLLWLVSRGQR